MWWWGELKLQNVLLLVQACIHNIAIYYTQQIYIKLLNNKN